MILDDGWDLCLATVMWCVLPRSLFCFVYFMGSGSTMTYSCRSVVRENRVQLLRALLALDAGPYTYRIPCLIH
jgi:hypothetical protein